MSNKKKNNTPSTQGAVNNKASEAKAEEIKTEEIKAEAKAETKPASSEKPKKKFNSKKLKYGTAATVLTIVVIAVVVLVNVIVSLVGDRVNLTIDLTSSKAFEISQESIDYINSLTEDIEIVTMVDESMFKDTSNVYYKQAYEVIKKYEQESDRITVKFVDMTADPTYANRYSEIYKGTISEYSIVISCGNRIKVISVNDLFNTELNYQTYSFQIVSSKAEQVLTSAIMYVSDPDPKKAVILEIESAGIADEYIQTLLEDDGFDVSTSNPQLEPIPADADLIVINAPLNDFSEEVVDQLYDYMENGGNYGKNLIYLASFSQKDTSNIDAFLAEWGIEVGKGVVGDTNTNNLATGTTFYAFKNYISDTDYSQNVAQPDLPVVVYNARPVNVLFENSANVTAQALLTTEDTAFVLTDEMQELAQSGTEPEIVNGIYNTMALANKYTFDDNNNQVLSNLLVIGASDMLDPGLTGTTYYNNGDYFISIVNAMTGKNAGITIVAKDLTAATFDTDVAKTSAAAWVFLIIIPAAVFVTGIVIWAKRRHK
ncbi:MAG: GldG family protein [Oscillospiraceae bacterium]|nr:GldG family protein [Oscillospiraceae bacterium]